ncbi:MAG: beta-lactamase family protein [Pirellulales bacterium]|nr:beta-lactamase family protein [Pirellulales bacterium]
MRLISATLLLAIISSFAAPLLLRGAPPEQAQVEQAVVKRIHYAGEPATASLAERMRELHVPGVSVAVVAGGRIAWQQAYGLADAGTSAAVTDQTDFQAASMSKPLTALAALALVDQGKLALDSDINQHLKRWQIPANEFTAKQPVTLRLLLSHRAGTTVSGFPGYKAGEAVPTIVQVLLGEKPASTEPVKVIRKPGAQFAYSGGGTTIVQLALEDTLGQSMTELMQRNVLQPLGMTGSTFAQPLPDDWRDRAAGGHDMNGSPIGYRTHPEQGAAGLWATAGDLARYFLGVQAALAGERGAILSTATATEMLKPVGDGTVGLGPFLTIDDGRVVRFGHGGANAGFRGSMLGTLEGGFAAVVLTNSDEGSALADEVINTVAGVYGWPGPTSESKTIVRLDSGVLDKYVGDYAIGPIKAGTISVRDGSVFIKGMQGEVEIFFESPTKFLNPFVGLEGEIEVGDDGVVSLTVKTGGQTIRVRKIVPKEGPK